LQQLLFQFCQLQLLAGLLLQQLRLASLQFRLLLLYRQAQQLACNHDDASEFASRNDFARTRQHASFDITGWMT
jgi:hypothetical protein